MQVVDYQYAQLSEQTHGPCVPTYAQLPFFLEGVGWGNAVFGGMKRSMFRA